MYFEMLSVLPFFSEKGFPSGGVAGIVTGSIIIIYRNSRVVWRGDQIHNSPLGWDEIEDLGFG